MPKFKNITNQRISIIFNGRKIAIERGAYVEGPHHFKLFKGLEMQGDPSSIIDPRVAIPELPPNLNQDNMLRVDSTREYLDNYPKDGLPQVAICILTKDSYGLIKDCVESIFNLVKYPNTTIHIFDTGTTDASVLSYYEEIKNKSMPVTIHSVGKFHFSKNYNDGIKQVDSEYILIQNNDTVTITDYVSKLMKSAVALKVGNCGPRMLHKNNTIQHDGQSLYHADGSGFLSPGHVNWGLPIDPANLPIAGRHKVDGITGAGILMRKALYQELGGFHEGFQDIFQDVHLNMLIRGNNYVSICDRDAVIYHYDNTSRKKAWELDAKEQLKIQRDSDYMFTAIIPSNPVLHKFKRDTFDLSIITLVNKMDQYDDFLTDLAAQKFNGSFEIIALPNFNNEFKSCSEALNVGKDISDGKICVYCHQDLRIPDNWVQTIFNHVKNSDMSTVGFMGMAGTMKLDDTPFSDTLGAVYLTEIMGGVAGNATYADNYRNKFGAKVNIQCLDELCLISLQNLPIRFDELNFNHYHWYGADACLHAISVGLKNYAIDAECVHLSDGVSNLLNESHREKFLEGAQVLYKKWTGKIPFFRTTTTGFSGPSKKINILFASMVNKKHNLNIPEFINM